MNEYELALQTFIKNQQQIIMHQTDMLNKFQDMLLSSEERIDRTNSMVSSLAESVKVIIGNQDYISRAYETHLNRLEDCRDKMLEESKASHKEREELRKDIEFLRSLITSVIGAAKNENNNKQQITINK